MVVQLHLKLLMAMLASSADQSHVCGWLCTIGDGLTMEGNQGVRRSTRSHMRPLQYWRNESVYFGREHTCECWRHKNGCMANAALLSHLTESATLTLSLLLLLLLLPQPFPLSSGWRQGRQTQRGPWPPHTRTRLARSAVPGQSPEHGLAAIRSQWVARNPWLQGLKGECTLCPAH